MVPGDAVIVAVSVRPQSCSECSSENSRRVTDGVTCCAKAPPTSGAMTGPINTGPIMLPIAMPLSSGA